MGVGLSWCKPLQPAHSSNPAVLARKNRSAKPQNNQTQVEYLLEPEDTNFTLSSEKPCSVFVASRADQQRLDDDLVGREARSLATQIGVLADILTVREFTLLRLKIDGTFDHLLFGDPDK